MNEASIRIHDDGFGRVHIRWFCRDSDRWHTLLSSFKEWFPTHHDRTYHGASKTWSVPAGLFDRLMRWIDAHFDEEHQEWVGEGPRAHTDGAHGRTYSEGRSGYGGYRQQTSTHPSTVEAAFKELHLLPSAPVWAAEAVYKAAVRLHHPDGGGDGQIMARINVAMERIREHQQHERRAS